MENIGIRGIPLKLFTDYVTNRTQVVKIDKYVSNSAKIDFGVPQGSVLGPSLFLIYINEICNLKLQNGQIITYADDTAILFHGNTWSEVATLTNGGLRTVLEYLNLNLLTLNVEKTKYLMFSIRKVPPSAKQLVEVRAHTCNQNSISACGCLPIEKTSCIKYLGIQVDDQLKFHHHVKSLSSRIRKLITVFKKLRRVCDSNLLKTIYLSLCQSVLEYCISIWGSTHKTHILNLERAQRAVLKVIHKKNFQYPTEQLYKDCMVLTVRQLYIRRVLLISHKGSTYDPKRLKNKRRKDLVFDLKPCNTDFFRRQPCYMGPYLYNKISKKTLLHNLPMKKLKLTIDNFLLSQNYESTENILKSIK